MKSMLSAMTVVCLMTAGWPMHARETAVQNQSVKERIGVYDSRAVAVAYAGSALHNQSMSALKTDYEKAKAAGDKKRLAELDARGIAQQKLFHQQGFSTAPVDNILEQIKDRLPAIREKAGVTELVSKWDKTTLAKHPTAEQVDVTMELVAAFNPNERQRKSAIEIQKHKPISLEQAEKIDD